MCSSVVCCLELLLLSSAIRLNTYSFATANHFPSLCKTLQFVFRLSQSPAVPLFSGRMGRLLAGRATWVFDTAHNAEGHEQCVNQHNLIYYLPSCMSTQIRMLRFEYPWLPAAIFSISARPHN